MNDPVNIIGALRLKTTPHKGKGLAIFTIIIGILCGLVLYPILFNSLPQQTEDWLCQSNGDAFIIHNVPKGMKNAINYTGDCIPLSTN